ncbi:myotubularin-related protein 3-like isoform X3 [Anguilla anguilla]|uniref:myotubularin-related protein 3-like isoform X3 n=1 Tax=Anguilla anguilla TaxID=7936 RepID=UPI0015B2A805|nr:myotubularin-related protein 3-like isoform X3 [Anguilla anguilla]
MGARDEEVCHSPARPKGTSPRTPPVLEEDSLQVPFLELHGEVTQYVGRAEDAVIAMSSYRLHIRFKESVVNVPLMLIESVEVRDLLQLHIICKDCKAIRCQFSSVEQCQEWAKRLTGVVRPPSRLEDLFSFAFHTCCEDVCAGDMDQQGDTCRPGDHVTSRFRNEVERMGFDTQGVWRISEINSNYRLCSSYPQLLLVPGWITDAELENVGGFRSWKRFPTVVYRHQSSGAVIARCAQPEVSWWGWRNADDERLVQSIAKACAADRWVRKHAANGTAAHQHGYRSASHERANGGVPPERTNGGVPHQHGYRSALQERANRGVPHECANRTVPPERTNESIPHERANERANGGVPPERTNESIPHERASERANGGAPPERTNGSIPHEHANRIVPPEQANGGVPHERANEQANGGVPHECANRGVPHECANGGVPQECANGGVLHECANGGVPLEHSNERANVDLPHECTNGTHASGNFPNGAFIDEHTNGTLSHREFDSSISRGLEGDLVDALPQKLLILDARSYAAAVANRAKGGGCECPEYYPNCEVMFMGMANIHSIRKSFQALRFLCTQMPDPANWLSALESTRWLQHLALLLKAALLVVTAVDRDRRPVLVHCSDGWDRTPQIVALSKLLLDPYYRTIEGFQVLVETEWLDFGHKFGDRCGHGEKAEDLNERCPVFLQWLDCVHQLHRQFPCSFQFNESFLVKLVQHTYSCLFGTFLCNSGRERDEARVQARTCSLWSLMRPANRAFQNILYSAHSEAVLRPVCHVRNLMLWSAVYLPSSLPTTPSDDSCAPYPSPGASPEEVHLGRLPKTRSFENLPSEAGGTAVPNRRSSDPNLKNKQPDPRHPSQELSAGAGPDGGGAADPQGAGQRGRRPSEEMEDERVAGEGFVEEEELKAAASEDEGVGPPVEGCAEEAELSVAVGVAEGQIENILQEATEEDDEEVTAEPKCPSEPSVASPSPLPTAPPSPPPMTPPTYLPLEGLEGPESQLCERQVGEAERAPETPVAPERPGDLHALSTDTIRTLTNGHAEIAETITEEGGVRPASVEQLSPCSSPPPPCCEAEPEEGRGLHRTPDGVKRPPLSPPPHAPVCNGVPRQDGGHGQRSPLRRQASPTSPPGAPPRCPQDGLALHSDAVQLRLRQMEAGHQLQVHTLKRQVQELWSRLESHHGNGHPGDQQPCSPDSDGGADPPCHAHAELLSEPSWGRLEQQDTEVAQWYPDRLASHCYGCEGRFWLANRKHHCRGKQPAEEAWTCGNVFCASCCEQRVPAPSRACQACRSALPPVDLELEKPITASSN